MDKKAIKTFAIGARRKLIDEVTIKAKRLGINESVIENAKQIDSNLQEIVSSGVRIQGKEIGQRSKLIDELTQRASVSSHSEAFQELIEEVAYTWFNRLIAIRFMEVNDYLPDTYRVLSSETSGKIEPDIITDLYDSDIYEEFSSNEQQQVQAWKSDNSAEAMDSLYQLVFIKICNQLNTYLPELFEKVEDYTELLFTASYIKKDGVIADLLQVPEDDFNVQNGGQVEIIGWLYQYYNSEPKDQVFARPKSQKVRKQDIPAVTQLFTPDWIVKYMVENSLGRFYIEKLLGNGDSRSEKEIAESFKWEYYLETADQPENVTVRLKQEQLEKADYSIENIQFIDPSMGSGHILVYAFEVFMQLYEKEGYSSREAAGLILEKNLYGLDIDQRAKQLAYFALMMKGREYNRQIFRKQISPMVFDVPESKKLQHDQDFFCEIKSFINDDKLYDQLMNMISYFKNGKEYGSLIKLSEVFDFDLLIEKMKKFGQNHTEGLFSEELKQKVTQCINLIKVAKLLSNKYEIVVTNPPYMGSSGMDKILSEFAKKNYPNSKNDLFAMFMEQCEHLSLEKGYYGMITQQAWMFLSSFQKMRTKLVENTTIINMANLGARAFEEIGGEVVQTTTFIFSKGFKESYQGSYIRLVSFKSQETKKDAYKHAIDSEHSEFKFSMEQDNFKKIPGRPIAYWLNEDILNTFSSLPSLDLFSQAKQGISTADNDKFMRFWFECDLSNVGFNYKNITEAKNSHKKWFPSTKGGAYRKWYGNNEYVVNWEKDGQEIKNFKDKKGKSRAVIRNPQFFFRKGLAWSAISSGKPSFRFTNQGFIFNSKGPMLFPKIDSDMNVITAYLNSNLVYELLKVLAPTLDYSQGPISKLPFKQIEDDSEISDLVSKNISISKLDWDSFETSWDFICHPFISKRSYSIEQSFINWQNTCNERFNQLKKNEAHLNSIININYGVENSITNKVNDQDITINKANKNNDIKSFISYSIGIILGRYSLDEEGLIYAGGEWNPSRYQKFQPDADNVLLITDDEYFKDGQYDIVNRFIDFVEITFGKETLEENLQFIADTLGGKGTSREIIRRYFVKDFYKDHLKTYSNRPIYWQLDSGKQNGFKALMYLHRYTPDQLGKVRTDYLHELQKAYDNRIELRQQQISTSDNQKEINLMTKEIAKIQKQLKEVREYDEKLGHLALKRIELDLDDGVIVNYDKLQRDPETGEKFAILSKGVKEPKK